MKFGLHIGQQNIAMAEMRKTWRWADTAGFDWVDVWDHFYEAPPVDGNGSCFEATTCMAAMACETKNVRIGVLVLGMNYRHPAILANALTTIDQLSDGRLEIGLGRRLARSRNTRATASPSCRLASAWTSSKRASRSCGC